MQKQRDCCIDLLKFIFVFLVVFYHSRGVLLKGEPRIFVGAIAVVEFFFMVSGYFCAKSASRKEAYYQGSLGKDTAHFMWRKICGLMPNCVVAWCLAFAARHIWRPPVSGSVANDLLQGVRELFLLDQTGGASKEYLVNIATWYLSAMLFALFLLYPLMRKLKDTFFYIIAPLLTIFLYGVMFQTFDDLGAPRGWNFGFIMKGTMRALAAIALGCVIFKIVEGLKKLQFTKVVRVLLTVVTIALWCGIIWYMFKHPSSKKDFDLVMLEAVALVLTLSNLSYLPDLNPPAAIRKIISWMGAFSFSLFLGHAFLGNLKHLAWFKGKSYSTRMLLYLGLAILCALFIMYFSKLLKVIWKRRKGLIIKS